MPLPKEQAWFRAKRFGWGWGFPLRWQGWVSLGVYFAVLIVGVEILRARQASSLAFAIFIMATIAAMIALALWKGERPRWRWGGPD